MQVVAGRVINVSSDLEKRKTSSSFGLFVWLSLTLNFQVIYSDFLPTRILFSFFENLWKNFG